MVDTEGDGAEHGVAVEQLEDCLRQAERDWEDALKSGDTQGASYAFGKRSAFITAIEVLQEDSQP